MAQLAPPTVAQPLRIPPVCVGGVVKLMLPAAGSVKSTVPPTARPIVPEVTMKFELTPLDVSTIAEEPELIDRLATVWLVLPLLAPLTCNVPPPTASAVFVARRLLAGEPAPAKLRVNVPLPALVNVPPPVIPPLPLIEVLPEPMNVNALPAVAMPPVSDNWPLAEDESMVTGEPSVIGPAYVLLPERLSRAPVPPMPLPFNVSPIPTDPVAV